LAQIQLTVKVGPSSANLWSSWSVPTSCTINLISSETASVPAETKLVVKARTAIGVPANKKLIVYAARTRKMHAIQLSGNGKREEATQVL
jgi:hypothetical protein